jgi:hypothetical protein
MTIRCRHSGAAHRVEPGIQEHGPLEYGFLVCRSAVPQKHN